MTSKDLSSRHFIAYPTLNQDAKTNAKVIIIMITKQPYLPATFISDKGSAFVSHVIKDGMELLQSTPQRSIRKQLACLNDLARQPNKRWRLKQAREGHCGISMSALRSLITHLITHVLAVSQAKYFLDVFQKMS